MRRFERAPEPPSFDDEIRGPGKAWLEANPDAKPKSFPAHWTLCLGDLTSAFDDLCAYSVMWTSRPTVDHYLSKSSREGRALTYEWSNYRRADLEMNQAKGTWDRRILDPFEVQDDWFEVLLPTLELIVVEERIPLHRRDDALFTLRTLRLGDDDDIISARLAWYEPFTEGMVDLQFLSKKAPLIARAVRKRLAALNPAAFDDEQTHFRSFLDGDCTLKTLRKNAPRLAETIDAALRRPDERAKRR